MQLQALQMGKVRGEDWELRGENDFVLASLPQRMTDGEVISVVEFAQKFEREAYSEGIKNGQGSMRAVQEQRILALADRILSLEAHNEMLANKLEELITGENQNGND